MKILWRLYVARIENPMSDIAREKSDSVQDSLRDHDRRAAGSRSDDAVVSTMA
jgi:hypothetical protein